MQKRETMIKTGGGTFDPSERNVYFLAAGEDNLGRGATVHDHLLIAINELNEDALDQIKAWALSGKKVFIDSGVFNLATSHAKAHDLSMDQALALAPDQIDGFDALFDRYISIIRELGDLVWGYIEIDQGGRENKIKTRARLEQMGLRPIPVYHPFNDGWEYFDYLAERYDRICFGNIVQANSHIRKRLLATAWERHRKYPDLWIHLLGLTPNQWLNAFPINSGDSSSWLASVRWATYTIKWKSDLAAFGTMPQGFRYPLGNPAEHEKAIRLAAYEASLNMRNWHNHLDGWNDMGCSLYPPVEKEPRRANA